MSVKGLEADEKEVDPKTVGRLTPYSCRSRLLVLVRAIKTTLSGIVG